MTEKDISSVEIPEEFQKITIDFLNDILNTFPELKDNLNDSEKILLNMEEESEENIKKALEDLLKYCQDVYPERFFDILYKNDEIFQNETINTHFLPNIDFKYLFSTDITENTKDTLWKYLQLILFTISNTIQNSEKFGDTAKLFEAIDEDELKNKMQETMNEMMNIFDLSGMDLSGMDLSGMDLSGMGFDLSDNPFKKFDISGMDMPNPEELNEHLNGLLNGKLGNLAGEIAKETANEMNIDLNNNKNPGDVFEKLFKNPTKLISMVKKVGKKLDEKLKSGEIKESELMEEASELMKKMKNMPGMKNMESLFSKMGMNNKNQKMNFSAMQSKLQQNIRSSKQKERMRAKLEKRKQQRMKTDIKNTNINNHKIFNPNQEKMEKTLINQKNKSKKRKKKKKKNKKK